MRKFINFAYILSCVIAYHNDQTLIPGRLRFAKLSKAKITKPKNQIQGYRLYNADLTARRVRAGLKPIYKIWPDKL